MDRRDSSVSESTENTFDLSEWESAYAHTYLPTDKYTIKKYKKLDEFRYVFDHVYNWCRSHMCLPQGVLKAHPEKDVEIMGKHYKDFTEIEETAYRHACAELEYYFEVCCHSF